MIVEDEERTGARDSLRKPTSSTGSSQSQGFRRSYDAAREEARLILEGDFVRLKALKAKETTHQRQYQRERLREPKKQSKRELQNGSAQVAQIKPTEVIPPVLPPLQQGRHRQRTALSTDDHHTREPGHVRSKSEGRVDKRLISTATNTMPQFDAPISAVNAGERWVGVQSKDSFAHLLVTPSTTCEDILSTAAGRMSEAIDVRTAVVLESFSQLGLERPVRRYERIRNVMNSWDSDDQNHVSIVAESDCAASRLEAGEAPRQQPFGTTVQLYHSRKPGKWDKRWLKLREDGQITMSRNENGIDGTNICHLSDCDVYTPTSKQIHKLKPPKKICYALKSQEKSSIFLDSANFVHFFCTKDKVVADKWYRAVQSWRSWYLFNMVGGGQSGHANAVNCVHSGDRPRTGHAKESIPPVPGIFQRPLDLRPGRPSRPSIDKSQRLEADLPGRASQGDGVRPLVDLGPEIPRIDGQSYGSSRTTKSQAPPSAFPGKPLLDSVHPSDPAQAEASPFKATGLLARSASRRSQGGGRSGRGVPGVDGKPLVELHPTSEFTDGSLLRKMEAIAAQQGEMAPKIDRQKRREINVAVGEGFD